MNNESSVNNFNPPWTPKQVFLTLLITFVLFSLFGILLGFYLRYLRFLGLIGEIPRTFFVNTVWGDLLMLSYLCLLVFLGYFLILKKIKGSKIKFFIDFSKIKKDLKYAFGVYILSFLGAILLGIFIILSITVIATLIHKDPQKAIEAYSQGMDVERAQVIAHLGVIKILMLIFMAPVVEEIFFRGCLYGALRKKHGVFFSIMISSIFFALMHGYLFNFLYILFMGIMGAWIYEKRKSLTAPIFFHFLWNGMVLLVTISTMQKGG